MEANQSSVHKANHLLGESSPYLLQHAYNPVNWYPWGEEALARAKSEDKPIFLSIGYAACHWCHVMERESFENEEIAAILNEHFVSIKVDREQRPDLDEIYMSFTQAMTGGGGWPMTVFLTPDLKPFFAGTYFPVNDSYGRPGFRRLITEISKAYQADKASIAASSADIYQKVTSRLNKSLPATGLNAQMTAGAAVSLMRGFDHANGGFGSSPKFPHSVELSLFLRHYKRTDDKSFLEAAEKALKAMARGGIYDHVGGGFARYSTDQRWLVPHFEKMLYDNGLLITTYVEAYQITGDSIYLDVIRGTLDWLLREMVSPEGGFYSTLDADSEGEEGKFYVWTVDEIRTVLADNADLFMKYYNVTRQGNFEHSNILNVTSVSDKLRSSQGSQEMDKLLLRAREQLLEVRRGRIRPGTDDKILSSWNGLALSALAAGYSVTNEDRYLQAAIRNAEFVRGSLYRQEKLTHAYREGVHSEGLFLEDYAYYIRGLLDLYEVNHSERWIDWAKELASSAVELYQDADGVFYLRPDNQTDLIYRPKNEDDSSVPAPGSIMIANLIRLNRLTETKSFLAAAEKGLTALSGKLAQSGGRMASAALALDYYLGDKIEIVIVGDGELRSKMLDELRSRYLPNRLLAVSDSSSTLPLFVGRTAEKGEVVAYVCVNSVCKLPVSTVEELIRQLDEL